MVMFERYATPPSRGVADDSWVQVPPGNRFIAVLLKGVPVRLKD
jgi:hypothetical protein